MGRIAAKSRDFTDYVRRALKKMDRQFELTDERIQEQGSPLLLNEVMV